ncbi:glycosyltransferase family 39 protein [Patescibacteria group bacterium]|nr:glycosyltransferase family 39 protein [Patescibacteria group bacterium]
MVVSVAFNLVVPIARNWSRFTEKFDPKLYEKKYNQSQYVIPQSKTPISDEELLSYAGYQYVHGINPVLINSDHPPLGKYLIGWFTVIFHNNRVVSLFFAVANAAIIALLIYYLTRSWVSAAIGLLFLSWDTMFIDQIIYSPILDIIQVFFLLSYCLVLLIWHETRQRRWLLLAGVMLGCVASVKLYFPALILIGVTGLFLLIKKSGLKAGIQSVAAIGLITGVVYTLTYWSFFSHGNNLRNFFGTQKWIFLFWQNNAIDRSRIFANAIPLILFNRWRVWWGDQTYVTFVRWSVVWPLTFVAGFAGIYGLLVAKKNPLPKRLGNGALFLSLWSVFYLTYSCFIPFSPRYLLLLFLPLYIIITLFIKSCFPKYV